MAINLLPKDISTENKVHQRSRSLAYFTYTLFVIGLAVMIGGAIVIYNSQRQVSNLRSEQERLLSEVTQYDQQENQLVLINDRLSALNEITTSSPDLGKVRDLHRVLYDATTEEVRVFQQAISNSESHFTVQANGSLALRNYLRQISEMDKFNNLKIGQLTFNPTVGYQVKLVVE